MKMESSPTVNVSWQGRKFHFHPCEPITHSCFHRIDCIFHQLLKGCWSVCLSAWDSAQLFWLSQDILCSCYAFQGRLCMLRSGRSRDTSSPTSSFAFFGLAPQSKRLCFAVCVQTSMSVAIRGARSASASGMRPRFTLYRRSFHLTAACNAKAYRARALSPREPARDPS
jgi:hypothetical protein